MQSLISVATLRGFAVEINNGGSIKNAFIKVPNPDIDTLVTMKNLICQAYIDVFNTNTVALNKFRVSEYYVYYQFLPNEQGNIQTVSFNDVGENWEHKNVINAKNIKEIAILSKPSYLTKAEKVYITTDQNTIFNVIPQKIGFQYS